MKKSILILFLFVEAIGVKAQTGCTADAGGDRVFCLPAFGDSTPPDTSQLTLGGFPAASGGIEPYTYTWTMTPITLEKGQVISAADILDDTTAANPLVTFFQRDVQTFFLTVRDSTGAVCRDTVTIKQNIWNVSLAEYDFYIEEGETLTLNEPNFSPKSGVIDSVLWRPRHGMIDSTSTLPVVSPTQNTGYYATIWDDSGCRATGNAFQHVTVYPLSAPNKYNKKEFDIYPNPARDFIRVEHSFGQNPKTFIQLIDLRGQTVKHVPFNNGSVKVDISDLAAGLYWVTIREPGGKTVHQKMIVRQRR